MMWRTWAVSIAMWTAYYLTLGFVTWRAVAAGIVLIIGNTIYEAMRS